VTSAILKLCMPKFVIKWKLSNGYCQFRFLEHTFNKFISASKWFHQWIFNGTCARKCNHAFSLWRPIGFSDFRKKNSSFRLPYQRPSSSADCTRELFNGSNGSASLVDCIRKKLFLRGGCVFFVSDVISGGLLDHLGPLFLALGANRLVVVLLWSFYWKLGYNPSL